MSIASWLHEWLVYVTGGAFSGLAAYIRSVDKRSRTAKTLARQNQRRLEGTDDPNDEGVLTIAYETRQRVEELDAKMSRQHRELMSKVEELNGGEWPIEDGP